VLARNARYDEVKANGIVIRNALSGKEFSVRVKQIDRLGPDDIYDYILVVVQNSQIDAILPVLAGNRSRNIVFVVNNPSGYGKWIDAVGYERVMIGFPSAGDERRHGVLAEDARRVDHPHIESLV